jgi:hypothetical protein
VRKGPARGGPGLAQHHIRARLVGVEPGRPTRPAGYVVVTCHGREVVQTQRPLVVRLHPDTAKGPPEPDDPSDAMKERGLPLLVAPE